MLKVIQSLVNDTLKKGGKWSRTSLTMATAWWACLVIFIIDYFINGINEYLFGMMLTVALGSKVTDALSKKMDPQTNIDGQA